MTRQKRNFTLDFPTTLPAVAITLGAVPAIATPPSGTRGKEVCFS
ncbi:hypothetical protein [uncultured Nostoc sp.]